MPESQTVLIVEDDPVFRRVLSFSLAKTGMTVETANHGAAGFERLMQGGIDFLVTDLQMPLCSGIELLERLQGVEGYVCPRTILCTAKGLELDSDALTDRFGLLAVMHKPFSPRKLADLISTHIQSESQQPVNTSQAATPSATPAVSAVATPNVAALSPSTLPQSTLGQHG